MAEFDIPVIDLEIVTINLAPFDIEVLPASTPVEIELGLTLPGPQGEPAEIYMGTEEDLIDGLPDPDLGNDGALFVVYVAQI